MSKSSKDEPNVPESIVGPVLNAGGMIPLKEGRSIEELTVCPACQRGKLEPPSYHVEEDRTFVSCATLRKCLDKDCGRMIVAVEGIDTVKELSRLLKKGKR